MPSDSFSTALTPKSRRRFATPRVLMALILREMSTRYGKSPGGYVWALLEPLGAIMILGIGFSLLLRTPSLGTSFLLFYASGFVPFNLFQSVQNMVTRALKFSKPLLAYPTVTWIDAILARFLLNLLTGLMVSYLLLTGILIFSDTNAVLNLGRIIEAVSLAALLALGIGTLNCFLVGIIPVWDLVWSIVTRPLFIASGVVFIYEDLPASAQAILWYNPLMHVTGLMRMGIFSTYSPQYISTSYVVSVSLICLVLGLILLARYHREILQNK